jgi:hypothetical protein
MTTKIQTFDIDGVHYRLQALAKANYRLDHSAPDGWVLDLVGPWPKIREKLRDIVLAGLPVTPNTPAPPAPPDIATLAPDTPVLYILRGHTFPHGRQLAALGYRYDRPHNGYSRTGTAADLAAVRDLAASLKLTVHPNTASGVAPAKPAKETA